MPCCCYKRCSIPSKCLRLLDWSALRRNQILEPHIDRNKHEVGRCKHTNDKSVCKWNWIPWTLHIFCLWSHLQNNPHSLFFPQNESFFPLVCSMKKNMYMSLKELNLIPAKKMSSDQKKSSPEIVRFVVHIPAMVNHQTQAWCQWQSNPW